MSEADPARSSRARELARAFDRSFAIARPAAPPALRDFLAIRVGGDSHAIALMEIAKLVPLGKLTALPGSPAECLGLAGVRGAVVPVYDLRALLGYPVGANTAPWLAILAGARVALTLDAIDGHLRLSDSGMSGAAPTGHSSHIRHVVKTQDAVLPLVDIGSVLEAIRGLSRDRSYRAEA